MNHEHCLSPYTQKTTSSFHQVDLTAVLTSEVVMGTI
uniref:Uncharacterized protein n=1 Tax=Anguilla anguilla TaxID=7936 RepID=A0A0E9TIB7_ANGAN